MDLFDVVNIVMVLSVTAYNNQYYSHVTVSPILKEHADVAKCFEIDASIGFHQVCCFSVFRSF